MEKKDFIVVKTIQIGVKANDHDEALSAVISGEGDVLATNYSANYRQPVASQQSQSTSTTTQIPAKTNGKTKK